MSKVRRSKATAGFTLIEALVTLAIVAGVLGAIGSAIATTMRGTRNIDQRLMITETAGALLASIPDRALLAPGSLSGMRDGYRWRMDTAAMPPASAQEAAGKWQPLAVTIRLQRDGGPLLQLTTYRLARATVAN